MTVKERLKRIREIQAEMKALKQEFDKLMFREDLPCTCAGIHDGYHSMSCDKVMDMIERFYR